MSDKKPLEEKLEGLSQLATVFELTGVSLDTYISQTEVKRLAEKMGKTINVTAIGFMVVETGASVSLVISGEKNKCLLIASSKDAAQIFHDAFGTLKVKKGE